jgi:GNAT superfamily N-acetyltransferase
MAFTIRQAGIHDAPAIARVHVESWKTTYPGIVPDSYLAALDEEESARRWSERLAAGDSIAFVAETQSETDSGIIGFISGGPSRDALGNCDAELFGIGNCDAELYAIYLLHAQQRLGAGRLLTHALATALRDIGHQSLLVWALEQNPAVYFYQRFGAVRIAERSIEIGGVHLPELAFAWRSLDNLVRITSTPAPTNEPDADNLSAASESHSPS